MARRSQPRLELRANQCDLTIALAVALCALRRHADLRHLRARRRSKLRVVSVDAIAGSIKRRALCLTCKRLASCRSPRFIHADCALDGRGYRPADDGRRSIRHRLFYALCRRDLGRWTEWISYRWTPYRLHSRARKILVSGRSDASAKCWYYSRTA